LCWTDTIHWGSMCWIYWITLGKWISFIKLIIQFLHHVILIVFVWLTYQKLAQ
jgi:hypothetical protein